MEKLIGDESVNEEENLCGTVGIGEDVSVNRQSKCDS